MLTWGQAACMALDEPPTAENRKKAKDFFENSPLGVAYLLNSDPLEPIIKAKTVLEKNPYKYKTYPKTPPTSPVLTAEVEIPTPEDDGSGNESDSSSGSTVTYGRREIIDVARTLFSARNPGNDELFEQKYLTNTNIHETIQFHLSKLAEHFGPSRTKRVNGSIKRGRYLWVAKPAIREFLLKPAAGIEAHMNSNAGRWVNIGYARKSPGNESDETRSRLLQLMMWRLKKRCFCSKIFVSPTCTAGSPLLERDCPKPTFLSQLSGCDGDIQDLFTCAATSLKKVRLCVIDFAGLTNDPVDLKKTLKLNRAIKEVIVDHGNRYDIFDRYSLLHDKTVIRQFRSRAKCVPRSKV